MVFPNSIYWIIPFLHWFEMLPLLYIEFLQVLGSVSEVSVLPLDLCVLSEAQFLICVSGSSSLPSSVSLHPSCAMLVHFPFSLPNGSHPASWPKVWAMHWWYMTLFLWPRPLPWTPSPCSHLSSPSPLWRINLHFKFNISKSELLIFPRTWFSHEVSQSRNNSPIFSVTQVKNLQVF